MSEATDAVDVDTAAPARTGASAVLAALGVLYLLVELWITYRTIGGSATHPVLAPAQLALALPAIVAAATLAGTGAGALAVGWRAARRDPSGAARWSQRALTGALGAVPVALLGAAGMVLAYRAGSAAVWVAVAVGAAALLGGSVAAVRPLAAVSAALGGALTATVVTLAQQYFKGEIIDVFGDAGTVGGYATAEERLQLVTSLVAGIGAGVTAFVILRRAELALPWPVYLAAGAGPGALLLVAGFIAWLGGFPLLDVIAANSEFDAEVFGYLRAGFLNHPLIVLFAGGVTAIVLVGRTLRAAR